MVSLLVRCVPVVPHRPDHPPGQRMVGASISFLDGYVPLSSSPSSPFPDPSQAETVRRSYGSGSSSLPRRPRMTITNVSWSLCEDRVALALFERNRG